MSSPHDPARRCVRMKRKRLAHLDDFRGVLEQPAELACGHYGSRPHGLVYFS
jgi:hypothetical protein